LILAGKRLLVGGGFIQLWSCEGYHEQKNLLEENVFWTCIWACKYVASYLKKACREILALEDLYFEIVKFRNSLSKFDRYM